MIVSNATLRAEDLVPAFLDALEEISDAGHKKAVDELENMGYSLDDAYEEDSELYQSALEVGWFLSEVLFELLNEYAPEGTYFGSNPSDGALFGFWEFE